MVPHPFETSVFIVRTLRLVFSLAMSQVINSHQGKETGTSQIQTSWDKADCRLAKLDASSAPRSDSHNFVLLKSCDVTMSHNFLKLFIESITTRSFYQLKNVHMPYPYLCQVLEVPPLNWSPVSLASICWKARERLPACDIWSTLNRISRCGKNFSRLYRVEVQKTSYFWCSLLSS